MADIFLEMGIAVHRGITKNKVMAGSFNQIEKIGDDASDQPSEYVHASFGKKLCGSRIVQEIGRAHV